MNQSFYQPARQNFSFSQSMQRPQGGFGGGQGYGGGFNPFQGGGQGFGFQQQFSPFQSGYTYGGGFGGFQQQFNPFQGGFGGGGFQPQGFGGGGYNPMFGGIGGLGFNPMMGQGFGMPMQGFGGFNPYQQRPQQQQQQQQQSQQNPFQTQDAELTSQMQNAPEYQAFQNAQKAWEGSEGYKGIQQKRQELARQMQQPMYGGIGGLGFNPMMGPQFGMPMNANTGVKQPDDEQRYQQEQIQMQQQRAMNPGGRSMQDWQSQYNQMYNPNRMTMDMAPSMDQFIERRTNPIKFPEMPTMIGTSPLADMEQNYMEGMRRSGQENMLRMSEGQKQNLQNIIDQMQNFGMNSPQMRSMLG